jgi:hypothetical protein
MQTPPHTIELLYSSQVEPGKQSPLSLYLNSSLKETSYRMQTQTLQKILEKKQQPISRITYHEQVKDVFQKFKIGCICKNLTMKYSMQIE